MKTLLVLGAGCSKGLGGIPADQHFLLDTEVEHRKNEFPLLHAALRQLYAPRQATDYFEEDPFGQFKWDASLEYIWGEIDEAFAYPKNVMAPDTIAELAETVERLAQAEINAGALPYYARFLHDGEGPRSPHHQLFMYAGWDIKKLVTKTCGKLVSNEQAKKYQALLKRGGEDLRIVSFNYDTLLEQSFGDWHYSGKSLQGCGEQRGLLIIKPHGSLNWERRGGAIWLRKNPMAVSEMGFAVGGLMEPSIVGLTYQKRELTDDEEHYQTRMRYEDQQEQFRQGLEWADRVVLIGYSLPKSDAHVLGLLKSIRVSRGSSNPIQAVEWVDAIQKLPEGYRMRDEYDPEHKMRLLKQRARLLFPVAEDRITVSLDGVDGWINS